MAKSLLDKKLNEASLGEIGDFINKIYKAGLNNDYLDAIWEYITDSDKEENIEESIDNNWHLGDKISIGKYTATVVSIIPDYIIFCMDQYWDEQMDHKEPFLLRLNKFIEEDEAFISEFNNKVNAVPWNEEAEGSVYKRIFRVPHTEELFNNIIPVFWKMEDSHNRSASRLGNPDGGWLMNQNYDPTDKKDGVFYNAVSTDGKLINSNLASKGLGIRLVFRIKNENIYK